MGKRRSSGGGLSLDSLMDTLTNVVGILLIILIFTVLSGTDAVRRIKNFVDEITDAQYAQAATEAEDLRRLLEKQKEVWKNLESTAPSTQLTIEQQKKLLEQLKADLAKLEAQQVDPEALKKQLEERRKRSSALEAEIAAKQKEIASLKARLAEIPATGPDQDAKIVNLPDPRSAPSGAQPVVFLCQNGRIVPVDVKALQFRAQDVLNDAARAIVKDGRIDCEKLTEIFEKRFVGDRFVQLKIRIGGDAKPYLAVLHREDAGEKAEDIARPASQFNRWIRGLNPQKQYIDFRVFGDSFENYLEARNQAAARGLLAGWTPYTPNAEYRISFGIDLETTCLGREPPKPSKSTTPSRPPAPADVVD